jgi:hypothetical protein
MSKYCSVIVKYFDNVLTSLATKHFSACTQRFMVWCRAGVRSYFTINLHRLFLRAVYARKPLKPACTIPCVVGRSYSFALNCLSINPLINLSWSLLVLYLPFFVSISFQHLISLKLNSESGIR